MPGPPQLTGIIGFSNAKPEATPEQIHGGPANPYHELVGEQAVPYPWEAWAGSWGPPKAGPFGAENELLGDLPESMTFQAGQLGQDPTGDQTPYRTHAAPNIRGFRTTTSPEDSAERLIESAQVHAVKTNASAGFQYDPTLHAQNDTWQEFYNPVPGEDNLPAVTGIVSAQAGGFGANDHRSNAYAKVNQYNFASSHRYRRYATGSVPGNYMWMQPGQRPMIKTLPGPARPAVGPGPFQGDNIGDTFGLQGAILQQGPTEYVSPPQVAVAGAVQASPGDTAPAIALW